MRESDEPAIEFREVSFSYPFRPPSLRRLSLRIIKGRKTAILGPNGAGKTTLLLHCNGSLRPDDGAVIVKGEQIRYDRSSLRRIRRTVGLVFQRSDSQLIAPTVYQDVAFGPVNLGMESEQVREIVEETLHAVGLSGYDRRVPHQLSEGEKKRVAIAGVLAMGPEVLVLDEPTASLDPAGAEEMMDLLDELHERGVTLVISTHDVHLALGWADDVILLVDGEKIHQGPPGSVFDRPELMRQAHLSTPPLVELVRGLAARGVLPRDTLWKGVPVLIEAITEKIPGYKRGSCGTIYIADLSNGVSAHLPQLIEEKRIRHTGAMGTIAKREAARHGIQLHFTHGVIDKCLLRATMGEDSLIMTTGGMVARVRERVSEFSLSYKLDISIVEIGMPGEEHID
ncbi:MAG: ATP-binding cassette domain-containing protein [Methanomicrobiales archaeon]|nr:ATP-binding cassette domain-containing protein [Methanomicrobiales archaeon]